MSIEQQVETVIGTKKARGALGRIARKKTAGPPSSTDPRVELKRLVQQHKAWTRKAVAIDHMSSDRKDKETEEIIPCDVPIDVRASMQAVKDALKLEASRLESAMTRALRGIPIYDKFLRHVFGCGPVVAAYLVADINIQRAEKISNLRRYCGLAVIDGRLERREGGPKYDPKGNLTGASGTFNAEIRTRLFQMFSAMWKNAAKSGKTSKYMDVWNGYRHRVEHSERVFDRGVDKDGGWTGKIKAGTGRVVSARGFAHSTGWHKAADVFVEDLYIVWRALEGLPVWPSYYTAKLTPGYEHGGAVAKVIGPRMLTVEEALAIVGNPGGVKAGAEAVESAVAAE